MSIEWVNQAIDDLRAWGGAHGVGVDVDEVRLLCDYASDYLEVRELGDFAPETFEELLLSIYPRKVIAPPESAPETLAAARVLVDFLQDRAHVPGGTAVRMRATLDRIEPEMPEALADTSRFGMAKSIFSAIGPESLDNPGPLAIPSGEAPVEELGDIPATSPLPAVRLAPRPVLTTEVRGVLVLDDAHRLAEWMLATGRTPTSRGALRVRDASAAAAELGTADPALLWGLAVRLGLVRVAGASVAAGERFAPLSARADDDLLDLWAGTVGYLMDDTARGTGDCLFDLCDTLYRAQGPLAARVLAGYLEETPLGRREGFDLETAVARLDYCGLTERGVGGVLGLTPLGVWGMRELYRGRGLDAPEAPDLVEADAHELIDGLLNGVPAEAAEHDIAGWLGRRSPEAAAGELLAAVERQPAVARGLAVTIVDRLGPEAEPAVRRHLADPELRPHAIHWLASRGLTAPPLTQAELLWMSVDMLALAMPAAGADPEEFAENLAASGPPAHVIEEMWRVDHPDVVDVLDLLGRSLPDGGVAKVARKAAFKARSRSIG